MSRIEVFYEGDFSTRAVHIESGMEVKTCMTKLSPTDLFAASLGACVLTVMALSAEKMGVDFSKAKATTLKEMSKTPPRRVSALTVQFSFPIALHEEMRQRLETAAKQCPIHHSLHPDIKVEFQFTWGAS
jgi:putative redox protein